MEFISHEYLELYWHIALGFVKISGTGNFNIESFNYNVSVLTYSPVSFKRKIRQYLCYVYLSMDINSII